MKFRTVIIVFGILIGLMFFILIAQEIMRDKPFNWYPSLSSYSKQPYGTSVFFDRLEDLFPSNEVKVIRSDVFKTYDEEIEKLPEYRSSSYYPYSAEEMTEEPVEEEENIEYFDNEEDQSDENTEDDQTEILEKIKYELPYLSVYDTHTFLSISEGFELNEHDSKSLLIHVYQGNNAFLAANNFTGLIGDYFGINTIKPNLYALSEEEERKLWSLKIGVSEPVSFNPLKIPKPNNNGWIEVDEESDTVESSSHEEQISTLDLFGANYHPYRHFDTVPNATVVSTNALGEPVIIRVRHGNGNFYFCSLPIIYSNYFMMKDHEKFIARTLSPLPDADLYWANNYVGSYSPSNSKSYLDFILSKPALKWAFYLLLFTVITFMIFEVKRKQKAIPIIKAPENTTLQFVDTIAQLYLNSSDHKDIAHKKFNYFLEYIRSKYNLKTYNIDEQLYKKLSEKTRYEYDTIVRFFTNMNKTLHQSVFTQTDLHKVHAQIIKFKQGKLK